MSGLILYYLKPIKNVAFHERTLSWCLSELADVLRYYRTITKLEVDNCLSLLHFNIHSFHRNWTAYCAFQKHANSEGAFDWEIWTKILKSRFRICSRTRNLKTDFNAETFGFGFSFLPFDWEIRKRIWKPVLRNSGLACAHIISKRKTAVHENNFANPFSDFPIER